MEEVREVGGARPDLTQVVPSGHILHEQALSHAFLIGIVACSVDKMGGDWP